MRQRFSTISTLLGLALIWTTFPSFSAEPILQTPEEGATISLMPKEIETYRSPAQRGWTTPYNVAENKHGVLECSLPNPVEFQWTWDGAENAEFTLQLATNQDFSDAREYAVGSWKAVSVDNLKIGRTYWSRVKATAPDAEPVFSAPRSFKTDDALPQWYVVEGISNVRDAGGWKAANGKRFKFGMVYRGSAMDIGGIMLTEEGAQFMRETLGIKVDLDLRGEAELGRRDGKSPIGDDVRWVHFPVSGYGGIFNEGDKAKYREIFKMLANEETYPIYIHCMAGADRCGTLNIAIKAVLGVSDDDIARDYEMTSFSRVVNDGERCVVCDYFQGMLAALKACGGETISEQFVNYLKSAGVTDEELDAIRALLLEDAQ